DQPREDRLSQYLAVNREILGEIIDLDSISSLLRPEAIDSVERQVQHSAPGSRARSPEELMEILLRIGDLTGEELRERCEGDPAAMVGMLERDGRILKVDFHDGPRWIATEERELYRSLESGESAAFLIGRYVQNHGPLTSSEIGNRFGTGTDRADQIARKLAGSKEVVRGHFRPGGEGAKEEWCYKPALERIHRQTITLLRREITPSTPAEFVSFLFRWQGVRGVPGSSQGTDLAAALGQLEGLPLPAEVWERDVLRARVGEISSDSLTRFSSAGSGAWVGSGSGRIRFIARGNGAVYLPAGLSPAADESEVPFKEPGRRILEFLRTHGASFFSDIREGTKLSLEGMNNGIAELFWNGIITNDVFAEVTAVRRPTRADHPERYERIELVNPLRAPGRSRLMQSARRALRQVPGWTGRWSLVRTGGLMGDATGDTDRARAQAGLLLERYGIVAREFHRREDLLPWGMIAPELARMELRGEIRRGYFVEGLSGMQFALPRAVEELRKVRSEGLRGGVVLLNACDPANPYGPGVDFSSGEGGTTPLRVTRSPSTYVAFDGGSPFLLFESSGARIRSIGAAGNEAVRKGLDLFVGLLRLPGTLRPFREIVVEYCDDLRPAESPLGPQLRALGFVRDSNQTMRRDEYA
ncbi:MAG TPA: crosslink repair DNA glycosylase YcaQ family protein, partial [Bacteroidota bacterium]